MFLEAGTFKDSIRNQAKYVSAGFLFKVIQQLRIGINAAVYSSKTNQNGDIIFAPIPMVSYTLGPVTANSVYMPKYGDLNPFHILGFYATVRIFEKNVAKK